jgi:CRISPR-associated protein Csd2
MNHRYDFIYLFDTTDANPNGDPDAGNLPRVDSESGQGLITDVCIKRKVRDYIDMTGALRIYVQSRAVLNARNNEAWEAVSPATPKKERNDRPKDETKAEALRQWMCANYFDIRTFGAVMTNEINCGQVRGPVQISFSRSVDPIVISEHALTVCAARKEDKPIDAQIGIQGRKFTVPYGLYRCHGFINPFLADQTGFSDDDLELFFQALENAFQFDQSAARPAGSMAPRALLIFRHDGTDTDDVQRAKQAKLGCAPSHSLFDRLKIESYDERPAEDGKPPRKFADYSSRIKFDNKPLDEFVKDGGKQNEKGHWEKALGNGVTLIRRI